MPWPKTNCDILNGINCITVILVMLSGVSSRCAEKSTAELNINNNNNKKQRNSFRKNYQTDESAIVF